MLRVEQAELSDAEQGQVTVEPTELFPNEEAEILVELIPGTGDSSRLDLRFGQSRTATRSVGFEWVPQRRRFAGEPRAPLSMEPPALTPVANLDGRLSVLATATTATAEQSTDLVIQGEGTERRVLVQVRTAARDFAASRAALEQAGLTVTSTYAANQLLQGWVPVARLMDLAQVPLVVEVVDPVRAVPDLAIGLMSTNTAPWHAAGSDGAGIKVGIVDVGFTGYAAILGTALPSQVEVRTFIDGAPDPLILVGNDDHGTKVAEILHGVAPGAELYFAEIQTLLDLEQAIDWLVNTVGVDVINSSISWYSVGPGDGTGPANQMVTDAVNEGVLWVTSAGNAAPIHWAGTVAVPTAPSWIEFAPGNAFQRNFECLEKGAVIEGHLRWADWETTDQDFDLWLVEIDWNTGAFIFVDGSVRVQNGGSDQTPMETVRYVVPRACDEATNYVYYGWQIWQKNVTRPVYVELFSNPLEIEFPVARGSITSAADAPAAFAVGAIDKGSPFLVRPFSSRGPTNGRGGVPTGGIIKPDISGYSRVTSLQTGNRGFDGTSAAAPFVAGAAAVMMSADALTAAETRALLEGRARDLGPVGPDNDYGVGRLDLGSLFVGITGLSLEGPLVEAPPLRLTAFGTYAFRALASPANATAPVSYTWSASGDATESSSVSPDRTRFRWSSAGRQTVTVVADNPGGFPLMQTLEVDVAELRVAISITTCPDGLRGTQLLLRGTSAATTYGVYRSTDLVTWVPLDLSIAGLGGETPFVDCGGPGWDPAAESSAFYRAGIEDDPDGDGLPTAYEATISNTDPFVANSDGVGGDDGSVDDDMDGLTVAEELNIPNTPFFDPCRQGSSDPGSIDTDGDGVLDAQDRFPRDPSAAVDTNCDGKSDLPLVGPSNSRPPVVYDAP